MFLLKRLDPASWAITPLQLLLVLSSIFYLHLKIVYPSEGIGWQDDLFISPGWIEHFFDPIINYYTKSCGRLGEMTTYTSWNYFNLFLKNAFGIKALDYPFFSWRIFDVLLATFALANLMIAAWDLSGMRDKRIQHLSIFSAFVFFACNINQASAVSLMIIFVNYCGPLFFLSWVLRHYARSPHQAFSLRFRIIATVLCFYIAITHEQLLFSSLALLPLYILFPVLCGEMRLKAIRGRLIWAATLLTSAALIFFLAPGQRLRSANLSKVPGFKFSIQDWQAGATETLYTLLSLPVPMRKTFKYLLVLTVAVGLVLLCRHFVRSGYRLAHTRAKVFFWAVVHLSVGYGIQVTLAISGYFPDRARVLPMTQLCIGLLLLLTFLYLQTEHWLMEKRRSTRFLPTALAVFGLLVLCYHVPVHMKKSHYWWKGWDEIGGRAARFYTVLAREAEKSDVIILYDFDACHNVATTYDVPHSTLWFLKWQGIDQKVEILTEGKVFNPLPAHLPRAKKPIPCG
jgi:hypothetical protein